MVNVLKIRQRVSRPIGRVATSIEGVTVMPVVVLLIVMLLLPCIGQAKNELGIEGTIQKTGTCKVTGKINIDKYFGFMGLDQDHHQLSLEIPYNNDSKSRSINGTIMLYQYFNNKKLPKDKFAMVPYLAGGIGYASAKDLTIEDPKWVSQGSYTFKYGIDMGRDGGVTHGLCLNYTKFPSSGIEQVSLNVTVNIGL